MGVGQLRLENEMAAFVIDVFDLELVDGVMHGFVGGRQAGFKIERMTYEYIREYLKSGGPEREEEIARALSDISAVCRSSQVWMDAIAAGELIVWGDPWDYWVTAEFRCFRFTKRSDGAAIHGFTDRPNSEIIHAALHRRELAEAAA
jgi:hypothetical protein